MKNSVVPDQLMKPADLDLQCFKSGYRILKHSSLIRSRTTIEWAEQFGMKYLNVNMLSEYDIKVQYHIFCCVSHVI